ncbi:MAG: two-component system response regulator NarL [Gammaproteobacteria bacterium]|nr:two-component system response regulator NarL [Gammaproteobacteria bacterium]MBU1491667.1 two-component system response regulator NarL [Gammaproteobacteria bacterium]MBU2140746.1 two-component system response regulator NarL [Gammaproteobacteria bacterium]MBU2215669.1 two-component system response regulator NarL [Gammaproteobacteria bacterium]MBU2322388.1 two-component system response regulator NarL [Gammaproteobacteria bacterium]
MNEPLSLLLIDDHPLLRRGLAELFESSGAFQVVGSVSSGAQGIELAEQLQPQMVLLDLHMPGLDGLATLAALKRQQPACRVMVLTASAARDDLLAALRAGADGYLLKDSEPEDLLAAVVACASGQARLDPALSTLLAGSLRERDAPVESLRVSLTERERQTLALIAEGFSNKLIGRQLGISDGTVKIYVKHLLGKLNLRSRLELAAWAHRSGLADDRGEWR